VQVINDNGSNGSTVGFNYDTTVDRGETITENRGESLAL